MSLSYYRLRDRIPYLLFFLMLLEREDPENKVYEFISISMYVVFIITFIRSLMRIIKLGDPAAVWGFQWNTTGPLSWGLFIVINYAFIQENDRSNVQALFYSFNSAVFGGWLYELPLFYWRGESPIWINAQNFLLVNNHFIIPFMIYYFNRKIRLRPRTKIAGLIVIAWMVFTYYARIFYMNKYE